jgi:hypothetical protein
MIRTPVAIGVSPSATDRNSGTTKKMPAWSRYWKKNDVRPARRPPKRRIDGSIKGSRPASTRWVLPGEEADEHTGAGEEQPQHRRQPEPLGGAGLRTKDAPRARAQHGEHHQAEAERREERPDEVELDAGHGGLGGHPLREHHDAGDQQHLAHEHESPREVGRDEPADQGPAATAIAPEAATRP